MGYRRNLRVWEILGQVATMVAEAPTGPLPWNIVVMGMGEPLLNCEATAGALRILMDPEGVAVAPRRLNTDQGHSRTTRRSCSRRRPRRTSSVRPRSCWRSSR
jgi:hypothetical protein